MFETKPVSPSRRRFVLLSTLAGLTVMCSPHAVARTLREFGFASERRDNPVVDQISELFDRLDRRDISPETFVREVRKHYEEIDLEKELREELEVTTATGRTYWLYRKIDKTRSRTLELYYMPANYFAPPHAHHDHASAQCVLGAELQVRQYERVARLDRRHLTLRPVSDRIFRPYEVMATTEHLLNVHWFGPVDRPVVILNAKVVGGFDRTFEIKDGRPKGRYFVDPTTGVRQDDLIVATEIGRDEAYSRFSRRALREFAFEGVDTG